MDTSPYGNVAKECVSFYQLLNIIKILDSMVNAISFLAFCVYRRIRINSNQKYT